MFFTMLANAQEDQEARCRYFSTTSPEDIALGSSLLLTYCWIVGGIAVLYFIKSMYHWMDGDGEKAFESFATFTKILLYGFTLPVAIFALFIMAAANSKDE